MKELEDSPMVPRAPVVRGVLVVQRRVRRGHPREHAVHPLGPHPFRMRQMKYTLARHFAIVESGEEERRRVPDAGAGARSIAWVSMAGAV